MGTTNLIHLRITLFRENQQRFPQHYQPLQTMYGSTSIKNVQLVGCRLLPEVATLIVKQVLMESSSLKMGNSSVRAAMLLIRNIAQLVRKSSQPTVLSQTATYTMQSA